MNYVLEVQYRHSALVLQSQHSTQRGVLFKQLFIQPVPQTLAQRQSYFVLSFSLIYTNRKIGNNIVNVS